MTQMQEVLYVSGSLHTPAMHMLLSRVGRISNSDLEFFGPGLLIPSPDKGKIFDHIHTL